MANIVFSFLNRFLWELQTQLPCHVNTFLRKLRHSAGVNTILSLSQLFFFHPVRKRSHLHLCFHRTQSCLTFFPILRCNAFVNCIRVEMFFASTISRLRILLISVATLVSLSIRFLIFHVQLN